MYKLSSWLQICPNLVDIRSAGFFLFLLPFRVPRPDAQEPRHVHAVNLLHAPATLQQRVVGGIDEIRQRQTGLICSVSAAFVGNSSRMAVVCV